MYPKTYNTGDALTAEDLNYLMQASMIGQWQDYTPVLTAHLSNPVMSAGSITGRYTTIGKTIHFGIYMTGVQVSNAGNGVWQLSLPVAPLNERMAIFTGALLGGSPYKHVWGRPAYGDKTTLHLDSTTSNDGTITNTTYTSLVNSVGSAIGLTMNGTYEIA